jgi:hypothetical protein
MDVPDLLDAMQRLPASAQCSRSIETWPAAISQSHNKGRYQRQEVTRGSRVRPWLVGAAPATSCGNNAIRPSERMRAQRAFQTEHPEASSPRMTNDPPAQ